MHGIENKENMLLSGRSSPLLTGEPPQTSPQAPESEVEVGFDQKKTSELDFVNNHLLRHPEDVAGGEGHVGGGAPLRLYMLQLIWIIS